MRKPTTYLKVIETLTICPYCNGTGTRYVKEYHNRVISEQCKCKAGQLTGTKLIDASEEVRQLRLKVKNLNARIKKLKTASNL
jgi:ubiquinone biosynthesis protein UbiJ